MTLSTSSMIAVSILALSTVVDAQVRLRNRPVRLLEKVFLDFQERVLEEPLSDEMELGGFSMDLSQSLSLSLSMSMEDGWTQRLLKRSYADDAHDDMKLVKA